MNQSAKVSRPLAADVVPTDLDTQSGTTDINAITDPAKLASPVRQTATRETSTDAPDELDQPSAVSAFTRAIYSRPAGTVEQTPSTSGGADLSTNTPHEQDLPTSVADAIDTRQVDPAKGTSSTLHYTDLWDRIRSGLRLPKLEDRRVAYHERWFSKNPKYMKRKMERARLFLYHIVEELDRRGLPMDLALLPAIESAYQPHAYSHARASGLWQFIASTARRYGLKVNWWYDGRRDVVASTTAALNYLEDLHAEFDDWYLALAAYNAGEGKIRYLRERNRRRGLPTGYLHLPRLRAETQHYVPKLMAMINIVSNPEKYGITLEPIPNEPYFGRVDLGSQIDLNVVAKLADVPVGDLYDINPGFRRWATDPTGPHQVLVPIDNKDVLSTGLANLSQDARIKWRRHSVKRGETLGEIAKRYGVSVLAIKKANNVRGTLIRVNQNLMIPISSRPLSRNVANITRPLPRSRVGPRGRAKIIHRVRKGETLWSIARKYRVYVRQLASWNRMRTRDILQVGRKLKIWISPTQVSSTDSTASG
ncbi:MAG: LysM peptidoglycan-binding domain-containing protein [Gammaproteobacteria bacterium]|nr:LysM peptidoglycan-binding domain-containing protein [Gammaproteobacteria bacterium]